MFKELKEIKILVLTMVFYITFLLVGIGIQPVSAWEVGLQGEKEYKEYISLTGEAILVSGKYTVKESQRKGTSITTMKWQLTGITTSGAKAELKRDITMITIEEVESVTGQIVQKSSLDKWTETVSIGDEKYILDKDTWQYSRSMLKDIRPAATYFAGNWAAKKIYQSDTTKITVNSTAQIVGFESKWATSRSEEVQTVIKAVYSDSEDNGAFRGNSRWDSIVTTKVSNGFATNIMYLTNDPYSISFPGSYILQKQPEGLLTAKFYYKSADYSGTDIPLKKVATSDLATETRIPYKTYGDIRNHWAKSDIEKIAGLGLFSDSGTGIFISGQPLSRAEFVKAISLGVGLTGIDSSVAQSGSKKKSSQVKGKTATFSDVPVNSPYFDFVETAYKRGLIKGATAKTFEPNDTLTRAQFATLVIRALGFEQLAQEKKNLSTGFQDDWAIPAYAKGYVYVAKELGLVRGDEKGYFKPEQAISKAEGATILMRFINYMQKELQKDYKEKFLKY